MLSFDKTASFGSIDMYYFYHLSYFSVARVWLHIRHMLHRIYSMPSISAMHVLPAMPMPKTKAHFPQIRAPTTTFLLRRTVRLGRLFQFYMVSYYAVVINYLNNCNSEKYQTYSPSPTRQCCRRCKPYFDNDPPIIVAFGPPDSKELIKIGHIFTTTGNSSLRNGHSVKAVTTKSNGNASHTVVYPVATNEPHGFSPETFRRELMQELNKDSKKPGFLRWGLNNFIGITDNDVHFLLRRD